MKQIKINDDIINFDVVEDYQINYHLDNKEEAFNLKKRCNISGLEIHYYKGNCFKEYIISVSVENVRNYFNVKHLFEIHDILLIIIPITDDYYCFQISDSSNSFRSMIKIDGIDDLLKITRFFDNELNTMSLKELVKKSELNNLLKLIV